MIPGMGGAGGGYQGGSAAASTGDQRNSTDLGQGDFGNIYNEGITLNKGFSFDESNPVHVGGALILVVTVLAYIMKMFKS